MSSAVQCYLLRTAAQIRCNHPYGMDHFRAVSLCLTVLVRVDLLLLLVPMQVCLSVREQAVMESNDHVAASAMKLSFAGRQRGFRAD